MTTDSFASLQLAPELLEVIAELGYESMTPIQRETIPLMLANKDVVGQAKTGSGKTAAFALPILQRVNIGRRDLQALILCPTRELSAQVAREIRKLARRLPGLQVLELCGGQPVREQAEALYRGAHIVVGTPGRIIDHMDRRTIDFSRLMTVVLDEADQMLDMGFADAMATILDETPGTRQTVMFSATFPDIIREMSKHYQVEPISVKIAAAVSEVAKIRQVALITEETEKVNRTVRLLQETQPESALIFCRMKVSSAELCRKLSELGLSVAALNGDLEQVDRDRVMAQFRNQSLRVLVATDVAARGLDVTDLTMVINFDLPPDGDTYVHRIGRTGRAGKTGLAISLIDYRSQLRLEGYAALANGKIELDPDFGPRTTRSLPPAKMQTLYIAGGRKEKVRPGDILGALTGDGIKLPFSEIGKIEVHDHFTYVAIQRNKAEATVSQLRNGRIKGRRFMISLVAP